MENIYYLRRGDQVRGPYSQVELVALGDSEQVLDSDFIQRQDTKQWVPATKVKGLKTVETIQTETRPDNHDGHETPQQVTVPEDAAGSQATGSVSKLMEKGLRFLELEVLLHAYRMGLRRFGRLCVYAVAAIVIVLIVVGLLVALINAMA